jgi:hypothetical protein
MTEPIDPKQQHLDDRADGPVFQLVETPKPHGKGMSAAESRSFLRGLHPVAKVKQTLAQAAKKVKAKG